MQVLFLEYVRRNCATLGHGGRGLPGVHYWARWSPCSPSAGLDLVLTSSACVLLLSLYRDRAGHCSCTDRPQQPWHDLREWKLCLQHHWHCPQEWWDTRLCWWGISRSMHRGSCLRNFRSRTIPPPLTQRWRSPICKVVCQTLSAGASVGVERDISKDGRSFPAVHGGSWSQKLCEHGGRPNVSPSVHSALSLESG